MSSSRQIKGEEWNYRLYFYPEADVEHSEKHHFNESEILKLMEKFIDEEEKILKVTVYKHRLCCCQCTQFILNHQFVVLETNKQWWWSIEKNSKCIVIQRSQHLEYVKDKLERNDRRTPIRLIKTATGRRTMMDLIKFLANEKELQRVYHYRIANCKTFARKVYDEVASKCNFYFDPEADVEHSEKHHLMKVKSWI